MPRLYLSPPHLGGAELDQVREALASNWVAPLGPKVEAFERAFARVCGLAHCAAVSSGTAAMRLALRLLGLGPGDVVLASSLTFVASVAPAVQLGAEPVFVDCDPATWNMDPDLLAEALDELARQGRRVRAVIPTDLYGQCADYDRLLAVCAVHGVPLVADAAEAVGATYKGRHAGAGARAAVYSFNGNKIITTGGGGMLASDDEALVREARRLSQQARDPAPHYEHSTLGYSCRLSNVLAAVGLAQLGVLEERVAQRRAVFEAYREILEGVPGLAFQPEAPWGRSNRWLSVLLVEREAFGADPGDLRLALERRDIETRPVWKPLHLQPVFAGARTFGGAVSADLFRRGLCLPSGSAMARADVERVCAALLEAAGQSR